MLSEHPIDVMLLATDLPVARRFYGEALGLEECTATASAKKMALLTWITIFPC